MVIRLTILLLCLVLRVGAQDVPFVSDPATFTGPAAATSASVPSFVSLNSTRAATESTETYALTVSNAIPSGSLAVVTAWHYVGPPSISGISDSRGNTWQCATNWTDTSVAQNNMGLWYSVLGTTLQVGDSVTMTLTNAAYGYRVSSLSSVTNATTLDGVVALRGYGSSYSLSNSVSAAAVGVGSLVLSDQTEISGVSFTTDATVLYGTRTVLVCHTNIAASGWKALSATYTGNKDTWALWAAFR